MSLTIYHHPNYAAPLPEGHRFPMGKYHALADALRARGFALTAPSPASLEVLARAQEKGYVQAVLNASVEPKLEREIGLPITAQMALRTQLSSYGTVLAGEAAIKHGLALNTAGGSHHARRDQGAGFCITNDIAVAACHVLATGHAERVLIVDLDVHQGDGTADIFKAEPRVFTFSLHAENNYPYRKIASDLDVGLPDGMEDDAYLAAVAYHLPALLNRLSPDLVFYNAGVDVHHEDKLGRLKLSHDGIRARDRYVMETVREAGIPIAAAIGGGYSLDVNHVAQRHVILFEEAAKLV
jgi:acetoin utilization deacetylase AcuC-like enzyme